MKTTIKKEVIQALIILLIENTNWDEEKVVNRVCTLLDLPFAKVNKIINEMDF